MPPGASSSRHGCSRSTVMRECHCSGCARQSMRSERSWAAPIPWPPLGHGWASTGASWSAAYRSRSTSTIPSPSSWYVLVKKCSTGPGAPRTSAGRWIGLVTEKMPSRGGFARSPTSTMWSSTHCGASASRWSAGSEPRSSANWCAPGTRRTRPQELRQLRDAGLRVFWIAGRKDLTTWDWLTRLVRRWDQMEDIVRSRRPGPWFFAIQEQAIVEVPLP